MPWRGRPGVPHLPDTQAPLPPPALDRLQEAYLAVLATQRRLSPRTLESYRRDFVVLKRFFPHAPTENLPIQAVRRCLAQLHAQGLSGRSIARTLSAWRGYYAWLAQEGKIPLNPCADLRPPKSAKRLPRALSVDEAMQLLSPVETPQSNVVSRCRDQAIFELFYSSGLRLSELASLDTNAVHDLLDNGEVRVTGKRDKTRIVPVGEMARRALQAWIQTRATLDLPPDSLALFVNLRGGRLSVRSIQKNLRDHAIRQGLASHVHPHMLRHSFASHVLQSSGDLRAVQEMLGHASIASTQVYTHLDFQHLAKAYDLAHPRARRGAAEAAKVPKFDLHQK